MCIEGLKWKEKPVCQSTSCGANFRAWRLSKVRDKRTLEDPSLVLMLCVSVCDRVSSLSREGHLNTSILVKMYKESEILFKESFVWT